MSKKAKISAVDNICVISVNIFRIYVGQLLHIALRSVFNLLYTDRLFYCYLLDESIFHFRDVGSVLLLSF